MKNTTQHQTNGPRRIVRQKLRNSISALLQGTSPSRHAATRAARADDRLEAIRDAMLGAIYAARHDFPQVIRRITHATDIQTLWYLRGDAMLALSFLCGEKAAKQRMAVISAMFQGFLPRGLTARSTSLGH